MSTSISKENFRRLLLVFCVLLCGCGQPKSDGETLEPRILEELSLPDVNGNAGVHPSKAVLQDRQNPFAHTAMTTANRWSITGWAMATGAAPSRISAMFYAWATELAHAQNGESQFQVAAALRALAAHESLDTDTRTLYRLAAIRAYQSMLDNFKDSLGYTAEGYSYRLVPIAFYAIRDLGGTPQGRWVETVDPYGNKIVVEN